jgi:hypothetical protein
VWIRRFWALFVIPALPPTTSPPIRINDLGAGFYDTRINAEHAKRNHIRQLEALGYKVTLQPAA